MESQKGFNRISTRYRKTLKAKYGLTVDQYMDMLEDQDYSCAICGKDDWGVRKPFVDHDHKTGEVRGLLCSTCNSGLGMFKDSKWLLLQAYNYLGKHNSRSKQDD